jgi:hypothetical protein
MSTDCIRYNIVDSIQSVVSRCIFWSRMSVSVPGLPHATSEMLTIVARHEDVNKHTTLHDTTPCPPFHHLCCDKIGLRLSCMCSTQIKCNINRLGLADETEIGIGIITDYLNGSACIHDSYACSIRTFTRARYRCLTSSCKECILPSLML